MTKKKQKSNGPIYRTRLGRLQISVFENLSQDGSIYFSTYIQRNYKAGDGTWKTGAFSEEDLDDLNKAGEIAREKIELKKASYSKQQLAA
ncbi:MAG: hypothetical protein RH917_20655 [Lacipirellulaceae bacterium]